MSEVDRIMAELQERQQKLWAHKWSRVRKWAVLGLKWRCKGCGKKLSKRSYRNTCPTPFMVQGRLV